MWASIFECFILYTISKGLLFKDGHHFSDFLVCFGLGLIRIKTVASLHMDIIIHRTIIIMNT